MSLKEIILIIAKEVENNHLGHYPTDDTYTFLSEIEKALEDLEENEEVQTLDQHKQMYINDKLWNEICNKSISCDIPNIELHNLRKILEKFQILGDEKDGM